MICYITDTHFGHANVIRFCDRPFDDAGVDVNGFMPVTLDELIANNARWRDEE